MKEQTTEKVIETVNNVMEFFKTIQTKDKTCAYCGSVNDADSRKCSSCGANLRNKK